MQNDKHNLTVDGGDLITAETINKKFIAVCESLVAVASKSREFVERCVDCGNELRVVKDKLPHGEWMDWLETNCPDISYRTAARLISISANLPGGADLKLEERIAMLALSNRLDSIRALSDAIRADATYNEKGEPLDSKGNPAPDHGGPWNLEDRCNEEGEVIGSKWVEAKPPSKICVAIARFWGAIKHRGPDDWDGEERQTFLTDLAERESIRRKQGWQLPAIDVKN